MRAFTFVLLLVLAGCAESEPHWPRLQFETATTEAEVEAYLDGVLAYYTAHPESTFAERPFEDEWAGYEAWIWSRYHEERGEDAEAAAYRDEAFRLGNWMAEMRAAHAELEDVHRLDMTPEASLRRLEVFHRRGAAGERYSADRYAQMLTDLTAAATEGQAGADALLAQWEATLAKHSDGVPSQS